MGCFQSSNVIDFDTIQPVVLRDYGGVAMYSGSTERGRYQTLGNTEIALTEDYFYSQVIDIGCCGDHGLLQIPVRSIKDVRKQSYFNGRYRADHPHMVITYVISASKSEQEYQAGWQMTELAYNQWSEAINRVRNRLDESEAIEKFS